MTTSYVIDNDLTVTLNGDGSFNSASASAFGYSTPAAMLEAVQDRIDALDGELSDMFRVREALKVKAGEDHG